MASTGSGNSYKRQDFKEVDETADGPKPMMNYKPAKTIPNSADQFRQLHEAEYEARGKRSTDQVERVHRHNTAYPVLKDELDKRRSTTKLTAIKTRREKDYAYVCSACLKLKERRMRKIRCQEKRKYKKQRDNRTCRCKRIIYKNKKYRLLNRGCQCEVPAIFKKASSRHLKIHSSQSSMKKKTSAKDDFQINTLKKNNKNTDKKINNSRGGSISLNKNVSRSSAGSLKNPSTNEPSVSSYHTFTSTDHEPMVA